MLGLKLATDPRWVNIVESNIEEVLTDHAWCEQKAATNGIGMIVQFPEYTDLVEQMVELVREEMEHFQRVHTFIIARGYEFGTRRKDDYVNDLNLFVRKGHVKHIVLIDRLLVSAMIEARSCERFRVLSQNIKDPELAAFYHELMISEATHYTMFIKLAKKYAAGEDVDKRWQEFLDYEATIIAKYGNKETIHG